MTDFISRKAVEKIIKEFFKRKVDEIPKREKFNKLCDLCDLYLELNAGLHKEIEDIPTAYDVGKVVEQLSLSEFDLDEKPHVVLNEVISIVKGAVKDEGE